MANESPLRSTQLDFGEYPMIGMRPEEGTTFPVDAKPGRIWRNFETGVIYVLTLYDGWQPIVTVADLTEILVDLPFGPEEWAALKADFEMHKAAVANVHGVPGTIAPMSELDLPDMTIIFENKLV